MNKLAREEISKVKPYIPGMPIEELKRKLSLREVFKLASNENAYPASPRAVRAARRAFSSINRYPDSGCFYLKKALARHLGVKTENIIAGNGSDELIILALRAFLKKGDEVIVAKPTFLIYEIAAQIAGAKIKVAPLLDFRYDIRKITDLARDKTKFIFIANPDNPTGTYVTGKEIDFLVSKTSRNTILFFDEAYFEFAKNEKDFPNTLKYLSRKARRGKNIIITRTFSKAYSLAGLRVGYAVADKEIIDCLNRVREPFNVNSIAQEAAVAALGDRRYTENNLRLIKSSKDFLYRELDSMGIKYIPSVTNFVLFYIGKNSKTLYEKLLKKGIIVREMSPWQLQGFLRVTVGAASENRRFIRVLRELL